MDKFFERTILITLAGLLFFSCIDENDRFPDDESVTIGNPIPDPTGGGTVTPVDNSSYPTGITCNGNGNYTINQPNSLENLEIPDDLPTNYDLSEFLPPIGNQQQQPSCVSWAVTYYMKSTQEHIQSGEPYSSETIMSPSYTYNLLSQGTCVGTTVEGTLTILKEKGAPAIEDFPIHTDECETQPDEAADLAAENFKISDFKHLSGINMVAEMKTLLTQQTPIMLSTYLSAEFGYGDVYNLTAYRPHNVVYDTGRCHAMLAVGYDDQYHAFKVVNSWGENWGSEGFVWIDYAAFDNVLDPTAAFRVINDAIIAYDAE